jgi:hypothetical protein
VSKQHFHCQSGDGSREIMAVIKGCREMGYSVSHGSLSNMPSGSIPVGDVEFVQAALGWTPKPNFYPEFLSQFFHRRIYRNLAGLGDSETYFVKSELSYKYCEAQVLDPSVQNVPPFAVFSDVVTFVQEWRVYVANGVPLISGWYDGTNGFEGERRVIVKWPKGFCGAVDFGLLDTGEVALVECQHPYACGWYGGMKDASLYVTWLEAGWLYLTT